MSRDMTSNNPWEAVSQKTRVEISQSATFPMQLASRTEDHQKERKVGSHVESGLRLVKYIYLSFFILTGSNYATLRNNGPTVDINYGPC